MSTVTQALRLHDGFTPVLKSIQQSMNLTINAFERMNRKTKDPIVTSNLELARSKIQDVGSYIKKAEEEQDRFNRKVKETGSNFQGLGNIIRTALGVLSVKKIIDFSDVSTQTDARLKLMNNGQDDIGDLKNKIFASAQRARVDYMNQSSIIASLGMQAGTAFNNDNNQIIAFSENLSKLFTTSGLDSNAISSTMYNLTQSLSSGSLLGNDYRILKQNAPQMIQYIQDYYGVTRKELDDMVSKGQVTAQGLKNAIFKATDDINLKFEEMPKTFGSIWTQFKNDVIKAFEPVTKKINDLINTESFSSFVEGVTNAMYIFGDTIMFIVDGCIWLANVLEPFEPILFGIGIGLLAIVAMWGAYSIATGIATVAQNMLNSAFWACPVVRIVALIVALIAILGYLWVTNDNVAKAFITAWDNVQIGIMMFALGFKTIWYGLLDFIGYFKVGALTIIDGFINGAIDKINSFLSMLNKIPGVSIDLITNRSTMGMDAAMEFAKEKAERDADLQSAALDVINKQKELEATRDERVANRNNWIDDLKSGIDNAFNGNETIGNIGTVDTVNSIKDTVDISSEDLKLMRELAEKKFIQNNISNQPIINFHVDNVNENADADFILDKMRTTVYEATKESMEGVPVG